MGIRSNQYTDNLLGEIDKLPVGVSAEQARALALYIKAYNDNGLLRNVSLAYIDGYTGVAFYKKFKRYFDQFQALFSKNLLEGDDIRRVFKRVASRLVRIPTSMKGMDVLKGILFEETQHLLKNRHLVTQRQRLVGRFKLAVKHYLNLTYELGFNEPSACVKYLAENHKLDKYVLAGDFPVMLLPFMPEIEDLIRKNYEHYEMQDAWELLKGRYFNHRAEYATQAVEIKSTFNRPIGNFSRYFDDLYTNTYYKLMLSRKGN